MLFYTFDMYHVFRPRNLFVFELIAFLMMLEKTRGLRFTRLLVLLSLLFPVTSLVEKVLRLSTVTEYTVKAVKVR